jgi:hypothetical protein
MNAQQYLGVIQKRPFRPFVALTASGERYEFNYPENTMISPSGQTVAVFQDEVTIIIDIAALTECIVSPSQPAQQSAQDGNT